MPQDREEEVDPLEDPAFRSLDSRLVQVHRCVVGAIIDILESVAEAAVDAIHVDRWGISLSIAHRTRRDSSHHSRYSSFLCHHQFQPISTQDLVVMLQQVVEVHTTIRGILFLILQGSTNTLRIPISRVVMGSIREVICHTNRVVWVSFQLVVLNGSQEDSLSRSMLLLVVQGHHDSTSRQVRVVVHRAEVFMPAEVEDDVSRP